VITGRGSGGVDGGADPNSDFGFKLETNPGLPIWVSEKKIETNLVLLYSSKPI